jgi:hypothetical protein
VVAEGVRTAIAPQAAAAVMAYSPSFMPRGKPPAGDFGGVDTAY